MKVHCISTAKLGVPEAIEPKPVELRHLDEIADRLGAAFEMQGLSYEGGTATYTLGFRDRQAGEVVIEVNPIVHALIGQSFRNKLAEAKRGLIAATLAFNTDRLADTPEPDDIRQMVQQLEEIGEALAELIAECAGEVDGSVRGSRLLPDIIRNEVAGVITEYGLDPIEAVAEIARRNREEPEVVERDHTYLNAAE